MLPDEKRRVQMIIMRGQKPVALRTGPFGSLSMQLFAEVSFLSSARITVSCMLRGPSIELEVIPSIASWVAEIPVFWDKEKRKFLISDDC
jgi:hypothetical protein